MTSSRPVPFMAQKYWKIKKSLLSSGQLFVDKEFPANITSLYVDPRNQPSGADADWAKPHDIADNPRLFVEGISVTDVVQGKLGNCWFVAACSALTHHEKLFRKVIRDPHEQEIDPSHPDKYCGIFHFTFWRMGQWIDVVVDDLLPVENGRLMFAHSKTGNEFWSALLEKAIAKVNGSYEALMTGSLAEALVDLSGGVPETISLKSEEYQKHPEKLIDLFSDIKDAFDKNALIAAAIAAKKRYELEQPLECGLVRGHSYAVTAVKHLALDAKHRTQSLMDIFRTPEKSRMVRLHNPWGKKEWNGPWSDGSKEWDLITEEQKKALGLVFQEDGEFWMEWGDFCKHFTDVSVCHVPRNEETKFFSEWTSGQDHLTNRAGGCPNFRGSCLDNPQFSFDITKENSREPAILHLYQENTRDKLSLMSMGSVNETIGMDVMKVEDNRKHRLHQLMIPIATSDFINSRSVFLRLKHLKRGRYVVVPSTFFPHREKQFLLRIFTPHASHGKELKDDLCTAVLAPKGILKSIGKRTEAVKPAVFIRIVVQGAENIPKTGTFCEVSLNGTESHRSPVVLDSSSPQYDFSLLFLQKHAETVITVEIFEDSFFRPRSLGKVQVKTKITNSMIFKKRTLKSPDSSLLFVVGTFDNPVRM